MDVYPPSFPPSPPAEDDHDDVTEVLNNSFMFLTAQAEAIQLLSQHFAPEKRDEGVAAHFSRSLRIMRQVVLSGGKIVFSGMGKSHKISAKLVATLQSFGISACLLHASEALHGDVGCVRGNDVVVLVSASGNSPELAEMMKHLPASTLTICMTCDASSPLAAKTNALIWAPVETHHKEQYLYGLPAPTISSTISLVLGDAICLALFESIERDTKQRQSHFARHHPGGAIGIAHLSAGVNAAASPPACGPAPSSLCGQQPAIANPNFIPWPRVPLFDEPLSAVPPLDLWRAAHTSPVVCAGGTLHLTKDVWRAIESSADLADVPGYALQDTAALLNANILVCRDETGDITGVYQP